MRFLIDAHLPRRLAHRLRAIGYDTLHTLDLPNGNHTTDAEINHIAEPEQRIVVTKDADFVNSFIVMRKPYKLLLVSTGNISNPELEHLFVDNISAIEALFQVHDFAELNRTMLVLHS